MVETDPLISIIIPVKNGAGWLKKTIPAILSQSLTSKSEVIVIDSGSTDGTLSLLAGFPIKVLTIPPSDFNHGAVRNLGVEQAKGSYVVMTVQDAEPSDDKWLQHLLDGFDDERVAGVCGQQVVPHDPDKNPVDWFRPISQPTITKYYFNDVDEFDQLPSSEKKRICSWDNVNAMYRKEALLHVPFRTVAFAEDALWANDALRKGYAIVYTGKARVNHYHFETPDYSFRRLFTLNYHFYKYFGIKPSYNDHEITSVLRNVKLLWLEKTISFKSKWRWLMFNYRQRQAVRRSIRVFNQALQKGDEALEEKHFEISGTVPQAYNPHLKVI